MIIFLPQLSSLSCRSGPLGPVCTKLGLFVLILELFPLFGYWELNPRHSHLATSLAAPLFETESRWVAHAGLKLGMLLPQPPRVLRLQVALYPYLQ